MRKETLEQEFAYHEINGKKPYFEGWYYKIQTSEVSVGVIVGIHYEKGIRNGFIQVLDTYRNISDYLVFPDEDIHIEEHKIKFKENEFTRHYLHFHDEEKQLHMDVQFHQQHHLHGNIYMPTIMGPFSYMEMECTHAIISLHHRCDGKLLIQGKAFDAKGIGYIEKDRGTSFPKRYLWYQSNSCRKKESCFFLSIADIPIKQLEFQGIICVLMLQGKQKRFATYLGAKVTHMEMMRKKEGVHVFLHMKQGSYELDIHLLYRDVCSLKAPVSGIMCKTVKESLNSIAKVIIYHHHKIIEKQIFQKGGCEISGYYG